MYTNCAYALSAFCYLETFTTLGPIHFLRSRTWKGITQECTHMDNQTSTFVPFCLVGLQTSLPVLFLFTALRRKTYPYSLPLHVSIFRLSMPSLKRTDAGLYQCMVRNRMGAVIHRRMEVQVACKYTQHTRTHTRWFKVNWVKQLKMLFCAQLKLNKLQLCSILTILQILKQWWFKKALDSILANANWLWRQRDWSVPILILHQQFYDDVGTTPTPAYLIVQ